MLLKEYAMRKAMLVLPVVLSAAGALVLAVPASAADSDVTVEVTAGELSISAPVGSVSLGTAAASPDAQSIGALLGDVTVTDGRGGVADWVVDVSASDLVGPTLGGGISYTTPVAATTGTVEVVAANSADILVSSTVQTASAVSGANTAVWSPTITVTLPAGAQVGTYTSTVTHSVS